MAKYLFVTGGVVSGIGKGITAASVGRLLKNRGLSVFVQKFDPYINVDPGTMSPYQHGEVFVTKDGAEADLDLGHYERFIDVELTQTSSITSGRVYSSVIDKERRGEYLGATVQVIPHITDEIKKKIYAAASESGADVIITEIGGTVGDIESLPFLEAVRQVHAENPTNDVVFLHTTLIPRVPMSNEFKTKPTQHSFKELMSLGIKANVIVTRCEEPLTDDLKQKISLFCDVPVRAIVESRNVNNLYEIPLHLQAQGLDDYILHKFGMEDLPKADMSEWIELIERINSREEVTKIALVGKYVQLHDAYLSVAESLLHAGYHLGTDIEIDWIDAETVNQKNAQELLGNADGILVPGGFGHRGIEGKITAAQYAREHNIPYFGICLGMQTAMIEFARHVLNYKEANSSEFGPTPDPVIDLMESQIDQVNMGGTLRLGNYPCKLQEGTKAQRLYQDEVIFERHRHRYEFNNRYRQAFEEAGVIFSGLSPDGQLVECVELRDHDYFVACQYHPEFKSRPNKAHPLFKGFVYASMQNKKKRVQ